MSFGKCDASSIQNARSRECEVAVPIWMETTDRKLMWHGMLLFPLGLITGQVKLRRCARAMAYWTALYGAYANWLTTMLAAIFGTAANTPIAAAAIMGNPGKRVLLPRVWGDGASPRLWHIYVPYIYV
jgi:hypothetical protein